MNEKRAAGPRALNGVDQILDASTHLRWCNRRFSLGNCVIGAAKFHKCISPRVLPKRGHIPFKDNSCRHLNLNWESKVPTAAILFSRLIFNSKETLIWHLNSFWCSGKFTRLLCHSPQEKYDFQLSGFYLPTNNWMFSCSWSRTSQQICRNLYLWAFALCNRERVNDLRLLSS